MRSILAVTGLAICIMASPSHAQQRPTSLRSSLIEENARWLSLNRRAGGDVTVNVSASVARPQRAASFSQNDAQPTGDLSAMGITVRWRYARQGQGADPGRLTVEVVQGGRVVLAKQFEELDAIAGSIQIVRLESAGPNPQVVLLTNGGGSMNHSPMLIATSDRTGGNWRWIEVDCCNGDPELRLVTEEDPDDRTGVILDVDITSLSTFSNADRWPTAAYRLLKLIDGKIVDVTKEERFRPLHQRRLAQWFSENDALLRGRPSPRDPSWQAAALGYVRIKALLGDLPQAWRTFSDGMDMRRDARLYREARDSLIGWNGITAAALNMRSPAPVPQITIQLRDVMMGGGIREVDVTLLDGNRRQVMREVIVNCGRSGIPQVVIGNRRWTINSDAMTVQEGPTGFPAVQIWRQTCQR